MALLICMASVCPVRADASHRSEQVSQLLFGEMCEMIEKEGDFVKIKVIYDNYVGWCQSTQLDEAKAERAEENNMLAADWVNKIIINDKIMQIPFGSLLSVLQNGAFKNENIIYKGSFINPVNSVTNSSLIKKRAFTFLNTPYLWGGKSVFGIDCSGFTQLVFKCINIKLWRDAHQQATQGHLIEYSQGIQCGDLAFFDNEIGRIIHTGILLDSKTIIHASGKVRIDTMDAKGIINNDNGKRTYHLKVIKRVINNLNDN